MITPVMFNKFLPYFHPDYLRAIRCMQKVADVSPNHQNIEQYVNNSISSLRFFPILKVPEDWFIVRMRSGWLEDADVDKEEQYSYPHNREDVALGRANLPKEPMFYGSITDDSNGVFESSRINVMEIADKAFENAHCRMPITMSYWRTRKPLFVYPLIHPSQYNDLLDGSNRLVSKLRDGYEKQRMIWTREENIDDLTLQINDDIYKFWAEEFQKHISDGNYQKTAYFTKIMLNEHHKWSRERKSYDGILYPSHKTYGRIGCNIAILPDVVDAQLELMVKGRGTLYVNKQSTKTQSFFQPVSHKMKWNGEWVEENILEQKDYNEDKLCEELCIKNVGELDWLN